MKTQNLTDGIKWFIFYSQGKIPDA